MGEFSIHKLDGAEVLRAEVGRLRFAVDFREAKECFQVIDFPIMGGAWRASYDIDTGGW